MAVISSSVPRGVTIDSLLLEAAEKKQRNIENLRERLNLIAENEGLKRENEELKGKIKDMEHQRRSEPFASPKYSDNI